jgi:hypothetical protein
MPGPTGEALDAAMAGVGFASNPTGTDYKIGRCSGKTGHLSSSSARTPQPEMRPDIPVSTTLLPHRDSQDGKDDLRALGSQEVLLDRALAKYEALLQSISRIGVSARIIKSMKHQLILTSSFEPSIEELMAVHQMAALNVPRIGRCSSAEPAADEFETLLAMPTVTAPEALVDLKASMKAAETVSLPPRFNLSKGGFAYFPYVIENSPKRGAIFVTLKPFRGQPYVIASPTLHIMGLSDQGAVRAVKNAQRLAGKEDTLIYFHAMDAGGDDKVMFAEESLGVAAFMAMINAPPGPIYSGVIANDMLQPAGDYQLKMKLPGRKVFVEPGRNASVDAIKVAQGKPIADIYHVDSVAALLRTPDVKWEIIVKQEDVEIMRATITALAQQNPLMPEAMKASIGNVLAVEELTSANMVPYYSRLANMKSSLDTYTQAATKRTENITMLESQFKPDDLTAAEQKDYVDKAERLQPIVTEMYGPGHDLVASYVRKVTDYARTGRWKKAPLDNLLQQMVTNPKVTAYPKVAIALGRQPVSQIETAILAEKKASEAWRGRPEHKQRSMLLDMVVSAPQHLIVSRWNAYVAKFKTAGRAGPRAAPIRVMKLKPARLAAESEEAADTVSRALVGAVSSAITASLPSLTTSQSSSSLEGPTYA